jgi:2-keto-4-pentenoate hydratase
MPIAIDAAVDHLLQGRDGHRPIPPLSDKHPELSMVEAYSVQRALEQALVLRGERVIGWKAGFTNAAIQGQYGVTEPVLGFMLGSGVFSGGDSIPIDRFASVGVEVEVAFLLKRDLAGPGVTPVSALLAVEGAMPSLELIDFRCSGKPRGADVVADGVFANAIVLGRPLTAGGGPRPRAGRRGVRAERPGGGHQYRGGGHGQSPHLARLARQYARDAWDGDLPPGDVVLSGSISKVLRPEQGESVRASFTRLGAVSCRFV